MFFLHRYYFKFLLVAFDFHMQCLGAYDMSAPTVDGISFEPKKLSKGIDKSALPAHISNAYDSKKRSQPNPRQASLMELDLNHLPSNVFALVPILIDDCNLVCIPLSLCLSLSLYVCDILYIYILIYTLPLLLTLLLTLYRIMTMQVVVVIVIALAPQRQCIKKETYPLI